jgi:branched-chain amino acid transport system ATP-binding protein
MTGLNPKTAVGADEENEGLVLEELSIHFGGLKAVDRVSFEVPPASIVGLIGPNGSGKSTILNLVSRIYRPTSGNMHFNGQDLAPVRAHEAAQRGISRTFQNLRLFRTMSVRDNLLVGCTARTKAGFVSSALRFPASSREERDTAEKVELIADLIGIRSLLDTPAGVLSYGGQKLVELGRALAAEPQLLLLDEPVAGMNAGEKEGFAQVLSRLLREKRFSILLVEHDMPLVMGICEIIHVLDFGQLIASGPPQLVQEHPRVLEAYLGVDDADED